MTRGNKFFTSSLIGLVLSFTGYSGIAQAHEFEGYAADTVEDITRDSSGDCVHDGYWTPEKAIPGCDGTSLKTDGDNDGDGVLNSADQCPNTPAGIKVDAKGCPLDSDGDGITDDKDECPDTPQGTKVDNKGCPLKAVYELKGVNFELNKATLAAGSSVVLDKVVTVMKRYPDLVVEIGGHTDNSGDYAYNVDLSQRRAESVRDYLISQGVKADNLKAKGYGPDKPVASNNTKEGRANNRRVELTVLSD